MSIKRRLDKLELANFNDVETKPLFVSIVPAKDGRQCGPAVIHHAVIAGTTFGKIMRNEAETEQSFARRVYAMAATEKHVEDGGQAIVGNVETGGARNETGLQSHGKRTRGPSV
ncbi:hypothetical protein [Ruegeria meonggei]|uniref:hypothetical protein n=1 Tax=Ruegeria meonggei TaxID=1446476 RepID=UPI00367254C8